MPATDSTPPLAGVLESSLYVADLPRAVQFYRSVLGLAPLAGDARFCALGVAGKQVVLLFRRGASSASIETPGGRIPPHDGLGPLHLAFAISATELASWESWLLAGKVAIESRVTWPRGGVSLYFRDPDANLVELATPGLWSIY